MSEAPEVSVVVVAYRARDYVLRCLESVRDNVSIPVETIVVDDGSGDGTPEAVRERFKDARVVAKEVNGGLCAGRNAALPLVRGRKVLMIDSDTQVRPGALETLARYLDENPRVGVIGPRLLNPDGSAQPSCRRWPSPLIPLTRRGPLAKLRPNSRLHQDHMMLDFDYETERGVVSVIGAAQMWRSDLPALIGEYDERISSYGGEDVDWCMRSWEVGLEVRFVPAGEIVHEWQAVVRRNPWSRHSLLALRDFYYLQWKHRALRRDPRIATVSS
ncbi:MAG TPA: glycosyltransferase [Solirubrobacterales bacterium]|nr:glycosyltransferase [Solirubrobacterales bacterium]